MTIDASWLYALKSDVPEAFTKQRPFNPAAIFIDGQIKLNSALLEETQTWDEYMNRQFLHMIKKYINKPGTEAVILAFDDYALVPNAKGMTQCKRRKHVPVVDFDCRSSLPPTVPKGADWIAHLCNRNFKSKLVDMIIYYIVTHLELQEKQYLIIDYKGHPRRYNHKKEFELLDEMEPLGESDVKFARYTEMYNSLQVDSIDGDSVPIALLYLQNHWDKGVDFRISIYRMQVRGEHMEPPAQKRMKVSDMGASGIREELEETAVGGGVGEDEKKMKRAGRVYEYLDINVLYEYITHTLFPQSVGRAILPAMQGSEICLLIGLIGMTGTDFTRKVIGVSGRIMYDYLPLITMVLTRSFDTGSNHFNIEYMTNQLVYKIYKAKYAKHVTVGSRNLTELLTSLERSKLSEKTKMNIPSYEEIMCTLQNINWLLQYWTMGSYPVPTQERYGFVALPNGAVTYAH
jgi:hypothetical protein